MIQIWTYPIDSSNFEKINSLYNKLHKVQEQRIDLLQKGEVIKPVMERRYEKLRKEHPIFYWQDGFCWMFMKHSDVRPLLKDSRLSADFRQFDINDVA